MGQWNEFVALTLSLAAAIAIVFYESKLMTLLGKNIRHAAEEAIEVWQKKSPSK